MAHFVYFVGHVDPIPDGHVPDSTEYTLLWDQLVAAVNGDDGGTYAPTSPIIIGASGVSLEDTGHELAVGALLTIQSTAEMRVANGGLIKLDGSAGDIRLEVTSNIATLTVETGAVAKINSGGALDIYGSLTCKQTSGPGSINMESGTTATWLSGSTLTAASGSTVNLTGSALVRGTLTIRASGGPGAFVVESGTNVILGGTTTVQATATEAWSEGATVSGVVTRTGVEVLSGTGARTARRAAFTLPGNADADCTVQYDRYIVPLVPTGSNRVYTVKHTGTVPRVGETIKFTRLGTTTPSNTFTCAIVREDATVLFKFALLYQGWCEVEWDGSNWVLIEGYQTLSGTSGIYDDVW